MYLAVTVSGQSSIGAPSGTGVLSPMGGMAPIGGFILASEQQQYTPLYNGSSVTKERRVSTARLKFLADSSFVVPTLSRLLIDDSGGTRHLNGFVTNVVQQSVGPNMKRVDVEAADHHWLMSRNYFTKTYTGQSDRAILIDIISVCGLSADISATSANIEIIESSLDLEFVAMSARDAYDKVSAITGGEWYVSQESPPTIYYRSPGAAPAAAFNVSDNPNFSTTFDFQNLKTERQHREPINDVRVLGGVVSTVRIDVTRADAAAKAAAGRVFHKDHVDSTILSTTVAELVGDNILARQAYAYDKVSFDCLVDGLEPDTEIEITSADFGLSAEPYVIQKVTMEQLNPTVTRYRLECGDHVPDLPEKLRGTHQGVRQEQTAPQPGGDGTVGPYIQEFGAATLSSGTVTVNLSDITDMRSAYAYFLTGEGGVGETLSVSPISSTSFSIDSSDGASAAQVGWQASGLS